MTLTKAMSCADLPSYELSEPKRVRWSIELEEVRYYKPNKTIRYKVLGSKLRKVRRKASVFAARAATGLINIPNELSGMVLLSRSSSYKLTGFEQSPNTIWDEQFERYGGL